MTYDAVVVGSSPVCLAEAAYLGMLGKRVLLAEKADRLGGAWSTVEIPGYTRVEFGAHLIGSYAELYRKMNRYFGLTMEPLAAQPQYVTREAVFQNTDVRWLLRDLARVAQAPFPWDSEAKMALRRLWRYYPRALIKQLRHSGVRTAPFHYPREGTFGMVSSLTELARRARVEVRLGCEVAAVEIDRPGPEVRARLHGGTVECRELVVPTHHSLSVLWIGERRIDLPISPSRAVTLFLVIRSEAPSRVSYLHFGDEPLIARVSDITDYVRPEEPAGPPGKVVAVQIHPAIAGVRTGYLNTSEVHYIFELLRARGLVGADAELVRHHWHTYERRCGGWTSLGRDDRKTLGARVRVLDTTTLSDSLLENFARWGPVFERLEEATAGRTV